MNYRNYLKDDVLNFWLNYGIDSDEGGVLTCLDEFGNVMSTEKNIWFVGRTLWSFAMAYRLVEQRREYLDACDRIYAFFDKCTLGKGRLPHITFRNGECKTKREVYYSEGFAAIGCAQYYRICKKEDVKKRAEEFFDVAYSFYTDSKKKIPFPAGTAPYASFGLEMFMLNVAQFVRNAGIRTVQCDELARQTVYNMKYAGHIVDDSKIIREYIPTTAEPLSPPKDLYTCPGHVFEAAWFVMCEGETKNDDGIREFGLKLLDYAMPEGFEKEDSMIITGINDPQYANYIWWPQCEAIIAYYLGHNISQNPKYLTLARRIEEFSFAHFADRKNGEWYTEIARNGEVLNRNKGTIIKGPFHLPRMLMAIISLSETGSICRYIS